MSFNWAYWKCLFECWPCHVEHLLDHFIWYIFQSVVEDNELLFTLNLTEWRPQIAPTLAKVAVSITEKSPHYFVCKGPQNVCQIIRYVDAILQKSSWNDRKIKTSRNHELQTSLTTLQNHQQSNPLKGLGQLKLQYYLNIKNNYFFNHQEQPKEGWYEHFV